MEWGTAVESACCRDELHERSVWSSWDGLNNESVYERCGMRGRRSGVECGGMGEKEHSEMVWPY